MDRYAGKQESLRDGYISVCVCVFRKSGVIRVGQTETGLTNLLFAISFVTSELLG